MALLVKTPDRSGVKAICAAFGKIRQRTQEHFDIVNIAHPALVFVHSFQIFLRRTRNHRLDNLGHVAEFFECQPQAVDGARLQGIHLGGCQHRSGIDLIHRSEQLLQKIPFQVLFFE